MGSSLSSRDVPAERVNKKTHRIPLPSLPIKSKAEIFDSHLYKKIDDHAIKVVGKSLSGTYVELALLITEPCKSDLDRARAIFTWLTAVNPTILSKKAWVRPKEGSPLEYIKKIEDGMGNKAYMYSQLCLAAGVPCTLINGINKSSVYKIGSDMDRTELGAQWNAVLIESQWWLVDPLWGSSCMPDSTSNEWIPLHDAKVSGDTVASIAPAAQHVRNDFFFLTDPEQLISTHLPDEEQWQMVANPVSIDIFAKQAYLRERFFDMDAQLIGNSLPYCVNEVPEADLEIVFGIPADSAQHLQFSTIIYQEKGQTPPDNCPLKRYLFYQKKTESVSFIVKFPVDGRFKIDIFGRHKVKHDTMELMASYIAVATGKRDAQPLPDEPEIGWGPQAEIAEMDLVPDNNEAIIETHDGCMELHFKKKTARTVMQLMLHNTIDERLLQQASIIQQDSRDVVVTIRLPEPGEYALKLFVDEQGGEDKPTNICNYLLRSVSPNATPILFPTLYNKSLGKWKYAEEFKVDAESCPESCIKAENRKLYLIFAHPPQTELVLLLTSNILQDDALAGSIVRLEYDGQTVFEVDLPKTGEYGINIFGKTTGGDSAAIYHVHSCLIEFTQDVNRILPVEFIQKRIKGNVTEIETFRQLETISLPQGSISCPPLVGCLQRQDAQDPVDGSAIINVKDCEKDVLKVKLPKLGKYNLDIFENKDGVLIPTLTVVITRIPARSGEIEQKGKSADAKNHNEEVAGPNIIVKSPIDDKTSVDDLITWEIPEDGSTSVGHSSTLSGINQQAHIGNQGNETSVVDLLTGDTSEGVSASQGHLSMLSGVLQPTSIGSKASVGNLDKGAAQGSDHPSTVQDTKEAENNLEPKNYRSRNIHRERNEAKVRRKIQLEKMEHRVRVILRENKKGTPDGVFDRSKDIERRDGEFVDKLRHGRISGENIKTQLKGHLKEAQEARRRNFREVLGNKNKENLEQMDEGVEKQMHEDVEKELVVLDEELAVHVSRRQGMSADDIAELLKELRLCQEMVLQVRTAQRDQANDGLELQETSETNDELHNAHQFNECLENALQEMLRQYLEYTGSLRQNEAWEDLNCSLTEEEHRARMYNEAQWLVTESHKVGEHIRYSRKIEQRELRDTLFRKLEQSNRSACNTEDSP